MEQNMIRNILLAIGAFIIFGILWNGFRRKLQRRKNLNKARTIHNSYNEDTPPHISKLPEIEEDIDIAGAKDAKISEAASGLNESVISQSFQEMDDQNSDSLQQTNPSTAPKIHEDQSEDKENKQHSGEQSSYIKNEIASITVMAPPNKPFGGYDLLQTILSNDMHYGNMQIFHRYKDGSKESGVLFSLASATEPGDFDLNNIGKTLCAGLILFMIPKNHENPQAVFHEMSETAQQLADDLGGSLQSNACQNGIY